MQETPPNDSSHTYIKVGVKKKINKEKMRANEKQVWYRLAFSKSLYPPYPRQPRHRHLQRLDGRLRGHY